jgi:hypothetical protein
MKAKDKAVFLRKRSITKTSCLEIFIREDGTLIFAPLASKTLPVFRKISGNSKNLPNIYCG